MGLELKVLNVTGMDYTDIILYLSAVINAAGKRPLIEDITSEHDFYYCIPHIEGVDPKECILDYIGIGYVMRDPGSLSISPELHNDYTVIIRLYDTAAFTPDGHLTVYVTDEKAYNFKRLCGLKEDPGSILVIKDHTGAVKKKIDLLAEKIKCDRIYTIAPNIPDKKSETLATHNDRYKFNRISSQLSTLIADILSLLLPDIQPKDIKRAYKAASGGHIR